MKVLFTNNYDANIKQVDWSSGRAGSEHLWGLPELVAAGHAVNCLPFRAGDLASLTRCGSWPQQWRILARHDYDLLYAGAHPLVNGLALARAGGLYPKPIVAICHHGLPGGRVPALQARGFDRLIFLSTEIARQATKLHPGLKDRAVVLDWGFDLNYHRPMPEPGKYLIAAGKTGRDYDTLCLALAKAPVPTRIFCSADSAPRVAVPDGVSISAGAHNQNAVSDFEMQSWYAQSFAVAIPLQEQPYLLGLTSLLDAMVHAKAVILTRTPFIDIDVDAEGCGISVAPGDTEGWAKGIRFLQEHPGEAERMGRRGRGLCEQRYHAAAFGQALAGLLVDLAQDRDTK